MTAIAKRHSVIEGRGVDADTVRIGKDVIELLTSGMYVSPVTIYREYIQNAADSFDAARSYGILDKGNPGKVSIVFDHAARSVTIRDQGAGIGAKAAVPVLLAMGASPKRGTNARGFRGVGRLSGLAYCRELEFRTKAAGEDKAVSVIWNCRALRERLSDPAYGGDLQLIVSESISVRHEHAQKPEEHFFEVHLRDIARLRNDILLNERVVAHYLAQVAPIPFAPEFSFRREIEGRLVSHRRRVPINLTVAGEQVLRPYRDEIVFPGTPHTLRVKNIEFLEFPNVDGEVSTIGWIAHHEYVRSIPPSLGVRGLRARVGDLQVGESNLFDEIFKEPRFNGWMLGEIHVTDPRVIPNGRRDNFETNHHYYNLLVQLGPVAATIAQRCRSASVSRNAEQNVLNVVAAVATRLKQRRSFDRAEISRLKSLLIRARTNNKRIADEQVRHRLEIKINRLTASLAKLSPKRGASVVAFDEAASLISRVITNRPQASKLIEALRRLCG
jgi:molecular chaperone HtpG